MSTRWKQQRPDWAKTKKPLLRPGEQSVEESAAKAISEIEACEELGARVLRSFDEIDSFTRGVKATSRLLVNKPEKERGYLTRGILQALTADMTAAIRQALSTIEPTNSGWPTFGSEDEA
jgi:hypothetical protein